MITSAFFPSTPLLWTFLTASLVLAITPGPAVLYIISRSLSQGRVSGLISVLAISIGTFGNALAAALGLGALFTLSPLIFMAVKTAGVAYLFYLGIKNLWQLRKRTALQKPNLSPESLRQIFIDGFLVALFNPHTTLFFTAFLPQFIPITTAPFVPTLMLSAIFVAIGVVTDSAYALTASSLTSWMRRTRSLEAFRHALTGVLFITLGMVALIF